MVAEMRPIRFKFVKKDFFLNNWNAQDLNIPTYKEGKRKGIQMLLSFMEQTEQGEPKAFNTPN